MNLKKFTFLIVILASMASSAQANNSPEVDLMQIILENAEFCVKGCSEERVYLQEEKIYPTAQGLLLSVND